VEIDDGDVIHTLSGAPTYTVQSVKDGNAVLRFGGALSERSKAKDPNTILLPGPPRSPFSGFAGLGGGFSRGVSLTLNGRGEIVKAEGDSQLPYLLGNLHEMALVPLPAKPQDRWKTQTDTQVTVVSSLFPTPPVPRGFRPPGLIGPTTEETLNASETTSYAVDGKTGGVKRTYKLATKEEVNGKPRVELTSQGTVAFAKDGFLPERIEWQGRLVLRKDGEEGTRPIKVTIRRLSEQELAERAKQAEVAKAEAAQKLMDDLGTLVEDLKSGDEGAARGAAIRLFHGEAGEGNAEVAAALAEAMEKSDKSNRWLFSQALAKWATPEQSDLLIAVLDEEHTAARHAAIDTLAARKVEAAIPKIAERLENGFDRPKAAAALRAFGPAAAEATAKQLENKEWVVRMEAAQVLKDIGTQETLPALKKATRDENGLVKTRAQEAVKAIEARRKT
ncbi:MAG TPA: HEAT repeat domain-containing protein, partial [Planctomycetaceae bacterium]